jgi:hypothetical protein
MMLRQKMIEAPTIRRRDAVTGERVEFAVLWPTINSAQLVALHFWHVAIAKSHELFRLIYEFPLVATLHIHTNTRALYV